MSFINVCFHMISTFMGQTTVHVPPKWIKWYFSKVLSMYKMLESRTSNHWTCTIVRSNPGWELRDFYLRKKSSVLSYAGNSHVGLLPLFEAENDNCSFKALIEQLCLNNTNLFDLFLWGFSTLQMLLSKSMSCDMSETVLGLFVYPIGLNTFNTNHKINHLKTYTQWSISPL